MALFGAWFKRRLQLREAGVDARGVFIVAFRGAKDSHMGVGWTGFNQAECVPSSVAPPIVAFCLLLGWQPLPTRGHLCRFKDHVSPYWCIRGVTPHSLIRRW